MVSATCRETINVSDRANTISLMKKLDWIRIGHIWLKSNLLNVAQTQIWLFNAPQSVTVQTWVTLCHIQFPSVVFSSRKCFCNLKNINDFREKNPSQHTHTDQFLLPQLLTANEDVTTVRAVNQLYTCFLPLQSWPLLPIPHTTHVWIKQANLTPQVVESNWGNNASQINLLRVNF